MAKEKCGLKGCGNLMGPGSAEVGFENDGKVDKVRICPKHAWTLMVAPRGSYRITPDRKLEAIPAKPIIIT